MRFFLLRCRILLVFLAMFPLAGCLFRSRKVERPISAAPLKTATKAELIDYINQQAAKIQTMQATVDIDTSVGGARKGKITDYQQIRGYILVRKPSMLRMIGLLPIVRNRAFDMVSNGKQFKLWIPPKNRFIEGTNAVETPGATQSLENLRPQAIYDALLVRQIDEKQGDFAYLDNDFETVVGAKGHKVEQPDYEIVVVRKNENGFYLSRKIMFSRTDLLPHRQVIYDEHGDQVTNCTYEGYKDYEGVNFPVQIGIKRPQEEYDITLTILKLQLNEPLPNDKFALEQPAGATVVHLDQPRAELRTGGEKENKQ